MVDEYESGWYVCFLSIQVLVRLGRYYGVLFELSTHKGLLDRSLDLLESLLY